MSFNLETLVVRFATDVAGYNAGLAQAQQNFIHTTDIINQRAAGTITAQQAMLANAEHSYNRTANRIGMIATGITIAFVGMAVHSAAAFDEAMTNTMAVMRGGSIQIREEMEKTALSISATSVTSVLDLAHAYEEMTRQGYSAAHSMEALNTVQQFSAVSGIKAGEAARELLRLQRALDLGSSDALRNAQNLRNIGDVITSVSLSAGVSTEHFLHGILRLIPTLRFLNKDLAEGAALLAAFTSSGLEAGEASQMAARLLQNLGQIQAKHEEVIKSTVRIGAGGRTQAGGNAGNRMQAQGFARIFPSNIPLHEINQGVSVATQSWSRYGIALYEADGSMKSIMDVMRQFERILDPVNTELNTHILLELGFNRLTARSIVNLLGSADAMQEFYLQAKSADGILEDITNKRLLSFNAQWKILKNNLDVLWIQFGRSLIPVLLRVNAILVDGVRYIQNFKENWILLKDWFAKNNKWNMVLDLADSINDFFDLIDIVLLENFGIAIFQDLREYGQWFFHGLIVDAIDFWQKLSADGIWFFNVLAEDGIWFWEGLYRDGWFFIQLYEDGIWFFTELLKDGYWFFEGLFKDGHWFFDGLSKDGIWFFDGLSKDGIWFFDGLSKDGVWFFNGLADDGVWFFNGLAEDANWFFNGLAEDGNWFFNGLAEDGNWFFSGLEEDGNWFIKGLAEDWDWFWGGLVSDAESFASLFGTDEEIVPNIIPQMPANNNNLPEIIAETVAPEINRAQELIDRLANRTAARTPRLPININPPSAGNSLETDRQNRINRDRQALEDLHNNVRGGIGDTFKEISTRRFILDTGIGSEQGGSNRQLEETRLMRKATEEILQELRNRPIVDFPDAVGA